MSNWGEMSSVKLADPKSATFTSLELRILSAVCVSHICVGYAMGAISPSMEAITTDFALTDGWRGALGAAALVGNMIGSPTGGVLADTYGRRICIISAWTALILGSVLQSLSPEIFSLSLSRAVVGWAVGAHYAAITTYLSEMLNPQFIGRSLSFTEFNFFTGNFIAIAIGALLNAYLRSEALKWRITLLLPAIPALFSVSYFAFCLPESQAWLDSKKHKQDHHDHELHHDLEIRAEEAPEADNFPSFIRSLVFCSCFWGSLVIPTYAVSAFAVAIIGGLGLTIDAFTLNTFLAAAVATGVGFGIPLVDSLGRKTLLLLSQWGVAAAFVVMAILQPFAQSQSSVPVRLALIIAFVGFEVLNGCGAPLALVYPAQIFKPENKGIGSGLAAMNSRVMAITVILLMSALISNAGIPATLLTLGGISAAGAIVTHAIAP